MSATQANITCREFVELVTEYIEGQIADVERHAIDVHLGDCPGCDEYVRQMRLTIAGLSGLADDEVMFPKTREQVLESFSRLRPPPGI
jgi:anti-sigma factor RsiW